MHLQMSIHQIQRPHSTQRKMLAKMEFQRILPEFLKDERMSVADCVY